MRSAGAGADGRLDACLLLLCAVRGRRGQRRAVAGGVGEEGQAAHARGGGAAPRVASPPCPAHVTRRTCASRSSCSAWPTRTRSSRSTARPPRCCSCQASPSCHPTHRPRTCAPPSQPRATRRSTRRCGASPRCSANSDVYKAAPLLVVLSTALGVGPNTCRSIDYSKAVRSVAG